MCRCTPEIRTPFCGKPGCAAPPRRAPRLSERALEILETELEAMQACGEAEVATAFETLLDWYKEAQLPCGG